MTEQQPPNIVLEHLREFRADIRKLTTAHEHLTAEVRVSNAHVAALVQNEVHTVGRFADLEARVDRIERRLQLAEQPSQDK